MTVETGLTPCQDISSIATLTVLLMCIPAAAVSGQYSSSYLAPFVAIAEALRTDFGFVNYQVRTAICAPSFGAWSSSLQPSLFAMHP